MNIERDIVIEHGRWCLAQVAPSVNLTRDTFTTETIQGIMDRRRSDLITGRVEYCEGASI